MKKKRLIVLAVLAILIVIVGSITITNAFMKPINEGGNLTEVSLSSCAKITLEGSDSINLSNTYPMSRNRGLQTTPYTFKVTSYCDTYMVFNFYLATLSSNTLDASNIHYIITNKGSKEALAEGTLTSSLAVSDFSETEITELNAGLGGSYGAIYKLYNANVPYQGSKEFDLYLFVDSSVETAGGTFKAGVAIKSYEREEDPTLADWVVAQYTGVQGENNLYYHNGTILDDDGNVIDAEDYSYRYAGSSDTTNNFVCFGSDETPCPSDNLYRIIGVFDGKVKLMKWDYANSNLLGTDGAWNDERTKISDAYYFENYRGDLENVDLYYMGNANFDDAIENLYMINLNINYINNIGEKWANKIVETTWKINLIPYVFDNTDSTVNSAVKLAYLNEIVNPPISNSYNKKIGLVYYSDYYYSIPSNYWKYSVNEGYRYMDEATMANWMYMGMSDFSSSFVFDGYEDPVGQDAYCLNVLFGTFCSLADPYPVRPVFFLNSNIKHIDGTGTKTDPIVIN